MHLKLERRKVASIIHVRNSFGSSKLIHSWGSSSLNTGDTLGDGGAVRLHSHKFVKHRGHLSTSKGQDNMEELERLKSQLEQISEQLNDVAMTILSEAIENRENQRPDSEKKVSQARRAVDKAIQHLDAINKG